VTILPRQAATRTWLQGSAVGSGGEVPSCVVSVVRRGRRFVNSASNR